VFSYAALIAEAFPATAGEPESIWIIDQRWSVTTTRHTNMCRAWLVSEGEARERADTAERRRIDLERAAAESTRARLDALSEREGPQLCDYGP
jgi:hypothetical protein